MDIAQEAPDTVVLTEDEASVYLQATTDRVWAPKGRTPVVAVHPGRDMVHFYGTLDVRTGREVATRAKVMNSEASAAHLEQVIATIPDAPILLVWDRAPWHFGDAVRRVKEEHPRLEIMYFPPASPELNPQEHVWKATRKAVSHNHTLSRLGDLADRFEQHLCSSAFKTSFLRKYGFDNSICRNSK